MRRRHPQGPVRERGAFWRHDYVPWYRRAHDQGAYGSRSVDDEDQGGCSTRAEVLSVDRWLHPFLAEHLSTDVDLKGRVRRVRANHRPQEVLLSAGRKHE